MIEQRLAGIESQVEIVRQHLPGILNEQRDRLRQKLSELKEQLDMDRLEQEMVIIANRTDVDEELDRLKLISVRSVECWRARSPLVDDWIF